MVVVGLLLEFAFPSLASILPFLEEVSTDKPPTWLISQARALEDYFAARIQSSQSLPDDEPFLISMVSHSGKYLHEPMPGPVSATSRPTSTGTKSAIRYYLLFVPSAWVNQEAFSIPPSLVSKVLSSRPGEQKAWTMDKTDFFSWGVDG